MLCNLVALRISKSSTASWSTVWTPGVKEKLGSTSAKVSLAILKISIWSLGAYSKSWKVNVKLRKISQNLCSQPYACRWPGTIRCQVIYRHRDDKVLIPYIYYIYYIRLSLEVIVMLPICALLLYHAQHKYWPGRHMHNGVYLWCHISSSHCPVLWGTMDSSCNIISSAQCSLIAGWWLLKAYHWQTYSSIINGWQEAFVITNIGYYWDVQDLKMLIEVQYIPWIMYRVIFCLPQCIMMSHFFLVKIISDHW